MGSCKIQLQRLAISFRTWNWNCCFQLLAFWMKFLAFAFLTEIERLMTFSFWLWLLFSDIMKLFFEEIFSSNIWFFSHSISSKNYGKPNKSLKKHLLLAISVELHAFGFLIFFYKIVGFQLSIFHWLSNSGLISPFPG